jgi:hypothetical protein
MDANTRWRAQRHPGACAADKLHVVMHLTRWCSGAGDLAKSRIVGVDEQQVLCGPVEFVLKEMEGHD